MTDATQDSPVSVRSGDVLDGKFRIERVLGEGGMGVVVSATHIVLGQLVALKFMLPQALAFPQNVARFEREARAAVRLKSDHVARVSDVGHLKSGAPYMVMEFLEGEDLDALVEREGPLAPQLAVDFLLQACEAVSEAHGLGIVHRDLKPKNLFLTKRLNGKPLIKVLDFGISKLADSSEDMSLTATTQVMGSPNYMSPEQLRSARDVDARTDIWALGAILYELLSGRVPFLAETLTQLTVMVIQDDPTPLRTLRPEISTELAEVITKCLAKRREDRFSSVLELAQALAPFASLEGATKASDILASSGSHPQVPMPVSSGLLRDSRSNARPTPLVGTDGAWDQTQLAEAPFRKGRAVAGVVGLIVVGTLVFVGFREFAPSRSSASPSAVVPSVVLPSLSVTPSAVAVASSPDPSVTSLPAAVSAPVILPPRMKRDAGTSKVTVPTQTSKPPADDSLPTIRN